MLNKWSVQLVRLSGIKPLIEDQYQELQYWSFYSRHHSQQLVVSNFQNLSYVENKIRKIDGVYDSVDYYTPDGAQVMQTKAQIAYGLVELQSSQRNQSEIKPVPGCTKRPYDSVDYYTADGALMSETGFKDEIMSNQFLQCNKRIASQSEIGGLQSLGFTMMNSSQS